MDNLRIFTDVDALMTALADYICDVADNSIRQRGRFNFVLSGGGSPKRLYELLASEHYKYRVDWDKTYFFFGDERFVPENDAQRNSVMAEEALFKPLKIKATRIFKVDTSGSPEEAAQKYAETIAAHFQDQPVEFDFNLLGLGDNSHTASLFPHTAVLKESEATVQAVYVEEVDMYRITMTAPLINQSKHITFLVFGKGKAEAVFRVLEDKSGTANEYPARLIMTDEKKVTWFLDEAAASDLKK